MVRVSLPGVNTVRKRLADGRVATYYYAWKGGPRLEGAPGSPEFLTSYRNAQNIQKPRSTGTLQQLLNAYQSSPYFLEKSPRTRSDYIRQIRKIELEFGDFPIAALATRKARGLFMRWRDKLAVASKRQADYAYSVLALVLAWAYDHGEAPQNPCERPGRVYRANRNEIIWTEEQEARFLAVAPDHLSLALTLAIWTGQRQGDLLALAWSDYDGAHIRLKQSKGGARVKVPVAAPLKTALDAASKRKRTLTILGTSRGRPWTSDGFRASWSTVCEKAGIKGPTFHDLRGTAVTRLALAGCSVPEIASLTGHKLKQVETILDAHYLSRDSGLAESAILKIEKHRG